MPDFHLDVCDFLEDYGTLGLLMMPRGHGKSTIPDAPNAWRLFRNPEHLILHQGATIDPDAYKVQEWYRAGIRASSFMQLTQS